MEWEGSGRTPTVAIGERPVSDWFSFALASPGEPEREGDFEDFVELLEVGLRSS